MPIRINLLAEAIAAEELRKRDPVKRAAFAGVLLVALSLVWYSSTWLTYMVDKENLNHVQADIDSHTNDYVHVQENIKKIADAQKRLDALEQLNSTRFLQGDLMNALQLTYVSNVKLFHLHVDQSYTASAAVAAKTNSFGVVAGRPAAVTEHVVVQIDARDFSPNPGDQVNHFKDALAQQAYFKAACDPANGVRLLNLSSLQTDADSKPCVTFSLECRFLDRP